MNWAMRCQVQSKERSRDRTDREKLTTAVLCWTVHEVLVECGHRQRAGEKQRICAKFSLGSTRHLFSLAAVVCHLPTLLRRVWALC